VRPLRPRRRKWTWPADTGYAAIRHEFDWKNYQGFWPDTSVYVRPWTYNGVVSEVHRRLGYLGGVRLRSRRDRPASGFVQALAGVAHLHTTLDGLGRTEISSSFFAIQLGGGGDVHLTRAVSVQTAGEIRIVAPPNSTDWHYPEWRLRAGVAYAFQR
jgi:hypothetical protein